MKADILRVTMVMDYRSGKGNKGDEIHLNNRMGSNEKGRAEWRCLSHYTDCDVVYPPRF